MKKKIMASLMALFVFSGIGSSVWADEYKTGVVNADVLNVRTAVNDGEVIHKLQKNAPIYIVDKDNSNGLWYKLKYNETQYAWVSGDFVGIQKEFVEGKVIKNNCNVRTQPNENGQLKTQLSTGASVQIVAKEGEWYKINILDSTSYIHDSLVEITDPITIVGNEEVTRGKSVAGNNLISVAKSKLGSKYVYGSNGPNTFDCSSYTRFVYKNSWGIDLPRSSREQSKIGTNVSKSDLQVGDLVFFDTTKDGSINHVGVYIGNGDFIHASSGTGRQVKVSSLTDGYYVKAFKLAKRVK